MIEVIRCPLLDILRFKRTWRMAKMFAIGFEVPSMSPMSRTVFVGIRFFALHFFASGLTGNTQRTVAEKWVAEKLSRWA